MWLPCGLGVLLDQYMPVQKLKERLTSMPKQLARMRRERSQRMSDTSTDTALMR